MLIYKSILRFVLFFQSFLPYINILAIYETPNGFTFSSQASAAVPLQQRAILGGWPGICTAEAVA